MRIHLSKKTGIPLKTLSDMYVFYIGITENPVARGSNHSSKVKNGLKLVYPHRSIYTCMNHKFYTGRGPYVKLSETLNQVGFRLDGCKVCYEKPKISIINIAPRIHLFNTKTRSYGHVFHQDLMKPFSRLRCTRSYLTQLLRKIPTISNVEYLFPGDPQPARDENNVEQTIVVDGERVHRYAVELREQFGEERLPEPFDDHIEDFDDETDTQALE